MKKNFPIVLVVIFSISGCTMGGWELDDTEKNKTLTCIDFRDGEKFAFNTNSITDIRFGFGAPTSFNFVTTDGKKKRFTSDINAYIKCEKSN